MDSQKENYIQPGQMDQEDSPSSSGDNAAFAFFLHLVSFLTLGFVSTSIGIIIFQVINKLFEDSASYRGGFSDSAVKYGIASLIIAAPIYFIFSIMINRHLFKGKISKDSRVRKWLTYIVLFIASIVIIGSLISLVMGFLEGEMALNSFLKILTVMTITGLIFSYYLWDVNKKQTVGTSHLIDKIALIVALAVVLIILISAFFMIEPPSVARDKKIDRETVGHLSSIQYCLENYYLEEGNLPVDLDHVEEADIFCNLPETEEVTQVEYKKTGDITYQLCANFRRSNLDDNRYYPAQWQHKKGQVCFDREIDRD